MLFALTVENRLLIKALSSVIRSRGRHIKHRFSSGKTGLARTLRIPQGHNSP